MSSPAVGSVMFVRVQVLAVDADVDMAGQRVPWSHPVRARVLGTDPPREIEIALPPEVLVDRRRVASPHTAAGETPHVVPDRKPTQKPARP